MWNFRWTITLISLPFFFIYHCLIQDGKRMQKESCGLLAAACGRQKSAAPGSSAGVGAGLVGHWSALMTNLSALPQQLQKSWLLKKCRIHLRNWSHFWLDNLPWMACGLRKCSLFCGWWNILFPLVVIELILKARGSCEREALTEWHENCSWYRYLHSHIKARISQDQWLFLVPLMDGRYHIILQLAVYTTYIPLIDKIKVTVYSL